LVSMPASMDERRRDMKPLVPSGPDGVRTTEPRRTTFRSVGGVDGVVVVVFVFDGEFAKKSGDKSCDDGRRATAPFFAKSSVASAGMPPAESLMALILSESESRGVLEPSAELKPDKPDIDRSLTDTSGVRDCCSA